jgi:hypothetical protein
VIHRVVTTTYILDVLSLFSVMVLRTCVLIWKNLGFGSAGNYLEAFPWSFGLKLASDGPSWDPVMFERLLEIKISSATFNEGSVKQCMREVAFAVPNLTDRRGSATIYPRCMDRCAGS